MNHSLKPWNTFGIDHNAQHIVCAEDEQQLLNAWQFPTLAWGDPTLPSALRRFTSEFGMGSGGTTALRPPGKFCFINPLVAG